MSIKSHPIKSKGTFQEKSNKKLVTTFFKDSPKLVTLIVPYLLLPCGGNWIGHGQSVHL